jgi:hypothetical protein
MLAGKRWTVFFLCTTVASSLALFNEYLHNQYLQSWTRGNLETVLAILSTVLILSAAIAAVAERWNTSPVESVA